MAHVRKLLPIPDETTDERSAYLIGEWPSYVESQLPDVLGIAYEMYYFIAQQYLNYLTVTTLPMIARKFGKRWMSLLNRNGLNFLSIEHFLAGCELSETLAIKSLRRPTGGVLYLPEIAYRTFNVRIGRGEAVPNFLDWMNGKVPGPALTKVGRAIALQPWNEAEISLKADEERKAAQALDTAQNLNKPAQAPVKFGETDIEGSTLPESSTGGEAP